MLRKKWDLKLKSSKWQIPFHNWVTEKITFKTELLITGIPGRKGIVVNKSEQCNSQCGKWISFQQEFSQHAHVHCETPREDHSSIYTSAVQSPLNIQCEICSRKLVDTNIFRGSCHLQKMMAFAINLSTFSFEETVNRMGENLFNLLAKYFQTLKMAKINIQDILETQKLRILR